MAQLPKPGSVAALMKATALAATPKGNETPERLEHMGNKKVRVTYNWRAAEGAPKQTKTSVMDFSNCTESQLIELALATAVIHVQRTLRSVANIHPGKPVDQNLLSHVDVRKDVVEAQSIKGDPIARAVQAARAAGLPEAELVKLADMLRANKKAS